MISIPWEKKIFFIHWPVLIKDSGATECFKGITYFKNVRNILGILVPSSAQ